MIRRIGRLPWLVVDSTIALPLGCVAALAWANLAPEPYYRFSHAVDFIVDDIGLALFFGVMTKQVVEERCGAALCTRGEARCCRSSRRLAASWCRFRSISRFSTTSPSPCWCPRGRSRARSMSACAF